MAQDRRRQRAHQYRSKEMQTIQRRGAEQGVLGSQILEGVEPFVGAVAVANVRAFNLIAENPAMEEGKSRPVVLAHPRDDDQTWMVWGLTSLRHYRGGEKRTRARAMSEVGLAAGYVWGERLAFIPRADIVGVVWAAPLELLESCASVGTSLPGRADLTGWVADTHAAHIDAGWYWPKP